VPEALRYAVPGVAPGSAPGWEPGRAPRELPPRGLELEVEWTLPDDLLDDVLNVPYSNSAVWDAYGDLERQLAGETTKPTHFVPIHRFLGHPNQVQNPMPIECELVSHGLDRADATDETKQSAKNWRLLLQVGTDDARGTEWGDTGRIFFWIREEDARDRDFDRSWPILQCS
jgi:hypothetical protein